MSSPSPYPPSSPSDDTSSTDQRIKGQLQKAFQQSTGKTASNFSRTETQNVKNQMNHSFKKFKEASKTYEKYFQQGYLNKANSTKPSLDEKALNASMKVWKNKLEDPIGKEFLSGSTGLEKNPYSTLWPQINEVLTQYLQRLEKTQMDRLLLKPRLEDLDEINLFEQKKGNKDLLSTVEIFDAMVGAFRQLDFIINEASRPEFFQYLDAWSRDVHKLPVSDWLGLLLVAAIESKIEELGEIHAPFAHLVTQEERLNRLKQTEQWVQQITQQKILAVQSNRRQHFEKELEVIKQKFAELNLESSLNSRKNEPEIISMDLKEAREQRRGEEPLNLAVTNPEESGLLVRSPLRRKIDP